MDRAQEILAQIKEMFEYVINLIKDLLGLNDEAES